MKIAVVYGGRGLIEDPTLYVLEKMQMVMEELRVDVERINLYEEKSRISTLPAMLKDCDGLVLAVSLEWFGIGGYMQEFLDACWLYGDKDHMQHIYMMPVVLATTSGELDAMTSLLKAWEVLGGLPAEGICAYVENPVDFELNKDYGKLIEKKTEQLYRTINQKMTVLPSSSTVIRTKVQKPKSIDLTPQESEQLSKFVSDDTYVKQQKEDIEELSAMFKSMLNEDFAGESDAQESKNSASNITASVVDERKKSSVNEPMNNAKNNSANASTVVRSGNLETEKTSAKNSFENNVFESLTKTASATADTKKIVNPASSMKTTNAIPEDVKAELSAVIGGAPAAAAAKNSVSNVNKNVDNDGVAMVNSAARTAAQQVPAQSQRRVTPNERIKATAIPRDFKDRFRQNFHPESGFSGSYIITITDKDDILKLSIANDSLEISSLLAEEKGDVMIHMTSGVLSRITIGEMTFQRAFMSGDMKLKGDFKKLRTLDQMFRFS